MRGTSVHRAFTRQQSNVSGKAPTGVAHFQTQHDCADGSKRDCEVEQRCEYPYAKPAYAILDAEMMEIRSPASLATFGECLRHLRRPARLTQRKLGAAVGYSEAHIAGLKSNQRMPDPAVVCAQFVEALHLQDDPEAASQLIRLAETAREMRFGPTCCAASTPDLSGGRGKSPR